MKKEITTKTKKEIYPRTVPPLRDGAGFRSTEPRSAKSRGCKAVELHIN